MDQETMNQLLANKDKYKASNKSRETFEKEWLSYVNENGHSFTQYVEEVTPATCLAPATATYKCANCEATQVHDVPDTQLDHDYSGDVQCNNDGTHQKKCVNGCGEYGPEEACSYRDETTPPTCTEWGYTTHTCTVCGYSYQDNYTSKLPAPEPAEPPHVHQYVASVVAPTEKEEGYTLYVCEGCGDSYKDNIVKPVGN